MTVKSRISLKAEIPPRNNQASFSTFHSILTSQTHTQTINAHIRNDQKLKVCTENGPRTKGRIPRDCNAWTPARTVANPARIAKTVTPNGRFFIFFSFQG